MSDGRNNEINIGILVVHGIGDQKQFDCLKGIAEDIVEYFQSEIDKGYIEVSVDINRATVGTFQSLHPAWQDGKKPPINVRIRPTGYNKNYNLHLREVWWADIDRPQNLGKLIKFWFWGLSLWAIPLEENYPILNDPEPHHLTNFPWNPGWEKTLSRIWARLEYFLIGLFLIIAQPILFVLKAIFRFFDWNVPLTIIADYVGKLRLYQGSFKAGKEFIEDRENSPRFSIQRRMINALARMAISDYDRWYVWSHSLGSIVAYNAFSMPETTLSHYITEQIWEEITAFDLADTNNEQLLHDINDNDQRRPRPYRPVWQQRRRISKKSLFSKCKGLLTYGSPFWRIVDLWPDLVKRNTQADFSLDFRWYNVIDPSDPVATRIQELFPDQPPTSGGYKYLYPKDVFYRTPQHFLLAHTAYLSTKKENPLIGQLWSWMSEARRISEPEISPHKCDLLLRCFLWITAKGTSSKRVHYLRYYQFWRFIWWGVFILIACLGLSTVLIALLSFVDQQSSLFDGGYKVLDTLKLISKYTFRIFECTFGIVVSVGFLNRLWKTINTTKTLRRYILGHLQGNPNHPFSKDTLVSSFGGNGGIWPFKTLKTKIVAYTLNQLVKNKEIKRDDSTDQYFFPDYGFNLSFLETAQWLNISEPEVLRRFIIKTLRFNPRDSEKVTGKFDKYYDEESGNYNLEIFENNDLKYLVEYQVIHNKIYLMALLSLYP